MTLGEEPNKEPIALEKILGSRIGWPIMISPQTVPPHSDYHTPW